MKLAVSLVILFVSFLATGKALGQSAVATLALGADRIGELKTAQGITTMIRFPEAVQEIICGDLYDAGTGKGNFVVQRSGTAEHPGNEVFIKPVSSKGASNMFVKTDGKHTYSFDLTIVGAAQAHRMVNVTDPTSATNANPPAADSHGTDPERSPADFERAKTGTEEQARQRAAEIIRGAQQQADRKIAEADTKLAEAEHVASQRADQEIERRFIQALMLGLREVKVSNTRAVAKKVIITLDQRMVLVDDKAYLRYTIQNTGDKDFTFTVLTLEVEGNEGKPLTAVINQSKPENSLAPGESLTGVIVFDSRQIGGKQRLALFLRGQDSAELAHVTIQQ
ncbi:MAG TPA: TrbG/VirB9 family P-type conjugative transfer protein [Blastocatellia bacterium]|nr:TrbG/VirB9 family P-type conjugative transfer protein [Blastocatellia bacterium]